MTHIIVTYVSLSFLVALLAFGRRISFAGALFTSVLMSPLVGLIAILKSEKNIKVKHYTNRYICPRCNIEYTQKKNTCDFCDEMGVTEELIPTKTLQME